MTYLANGRHAMNDKDCTTEKTTLKKNLSRGLQIYHDKFTLSKILLKRSKRKKSQIIATDSKS